MTGRSSRRAAQADAMTRRIRTAGPVPASNGDVDLGALAGAFASLDAGPAHVETMIHVYWTGRGDARDARDGGAGHRMQRDKITASLGIDAPVEPGFTEPEMQSIAYAAKIAALKCLRARRRSSRRSRPTASPSAMTAKEFLALSPRDRGYAVYAMGERDDQPNVPNESCPYPDGSRDASQWHLGNEAACRDAQDGDD